MTLELRGSARPTLQQALRWIGSRVDDIYGASIGKLEDIWMDPDSGEPLWLLVRDGRIGGRHTLVPFAQAASGAGHVWIPFEREVVRGAPAVRPSAPLSDELSDTLRRYYAESGHPVSGAPRADETVHATPQHEPQQAPAHAEAPREYTHAFANTAATPSSAPPAQLPRRPAPPQPESAPQRSESRPRQPWSGAQPPAPGAPPPEQPPLPPMPPRPLVQSRTQTRPPHTQPPSQESFTAPRPQHARPEAPHFEHAPQPPHEPSQPDQMGPPPRQAAPPPAGAEELHFAVGEGVDMELVGRLQFRGNIVRVQPLHQGGDGQN